MVAFAHILEQRALTVEKRSSPRASVSLFRAQRAQAAVEREQFAVLRAPGIGAPVEGVLKPLPAGLVPVIDRGASRAW